MGIVSKRDNDLIVSRSEPEGNRLGERDAVYGCKRDRKLKTMIGAAGESPPFAEVLKSNQGVTGR